jgi:hypothetical protein
LYWHSELFSSKYDKENKLLKNNTDEQVISKYFQLQNRKISLKKRKVHVSNEFNCPKKLELTKSLLFDKCERGENLNCFLSKKSINIDYCDNLFSEWGINHFHLGSFKKGEEFVSRTKDVLFAYITDNGFYALNILPHGKEHPLVWTNDGLINIIHTNWPDLISKYKQRISHNNIPVSEKDRKKARDNGINALTTVSDGTVYMPPGGGITTRKTSANSSRMMDVFIDNLKNLESYLKIKEVDNGQTLQLKKINKKWFVFDSLKKIKICEFSDLEMNL